MRAVVYDGPGDFSVSTVPTPEPRRGEVLIAVSQVGLCGTDAHIHHGEYGAVFPLIPGHEMTGTVVVLGEGVTRFQVGESVTVNPNIACGRCSYCFLRVRIGSIRSWRHSASIKRNVLPPPMKIAWACSTAMSGPPSASCTASTP